MLVMCTKIEIQFGTDADTVYPFPPANHKPSSQRRRATLIVCQQSKDEPFFKFQF